VTALNRCINYVHGTSFFWHFFVVIVHFVKTCALDRCKSYLVVLYLVVLSALILSFWQEVWIMECFISTEASNTLQWQGFFVVLKRFGIQNCILQSYCILCVCVRRICQFYVFAVCLFFLVLILKTDLIGIAV